MRGCFGGKIYSILFLQVVEGVNAALSPLSHFGFLSLLLPFVFVDVLTMLLLCLVDPVSAA